MRHGRQDGVRAYYASTAESEWARLDQPGDGAIEFALHTRFLTRWLPASGRVLDIGGGPGRYTLWLARRGLHVVLADLSSDLLSIARDHVAAAGLGPAVEEILEADAVDLSVFEDCSFDAVIALGPLYHLQDAEDRRRAVGEMRRVLRPGGVLFAAVMPRYARLLATVLERGAASFDGTVPRLLEAGVYDDARPGRFTGAYLFRPQDVTPFFEGQGFHTAALLASQGLLGLVQDDVTALRERDPRAYALLLDVAEATAADPSILGLALHLLYVGYRPTSGS
ncbi:MAG: methyltransferase domain-containing protein [Chloroflexota bacterium]